MTLNLKKHIAEHTVLDVRSVTNLLATSHTWKELQTFSNTTDSILVAQRIVHEGDTDTFIEFSDDNISITAGGVKYFGFTTPAEGVFQATINPDQQDIDFKVRGETTEDLFVVDVAAETGKMAGDFEVTKELKGTRMLLLFGRQSATGSTPINTVDRISPGTDEGYRMIRAGSVTGHSLNTRVSAHTTTGALKIRVNKNDVSLWLSTTGVSVTGTGKFGFQETAARNTFTFAAGDVIRISEVFVSPAAFTATDNLVLIEIVYDT